jgi:hypothetical protein
MVLSRETFYRYQRAVKEGGVNGLLEKSRGKANLLNRVEEATEKAVLNKP